MLLLNVQYGSTRYPFTAQRLQFHRSGFSKSNNANVRVEHTWPIDWDFVSSICKYRLLWTVFWPYWNSTDFMGTKKIWVQKGSWSCYHLLVMAFSERLVTYHLIKKHDYHILSMYQKTKRNNLGSRVGRKLSIWNSFCRCWWAGDCAEGACSLCYCTLLDLMMPLVWSCSLCGVRGYLVLLVYMFSFVSRCINILWIFN